MSVTVTIFYYKIENSTLKLLVVLTIAIVTTTGLHRVKITNYLSVFWVLMKFDIDFSLVIWVSTHFFNKKMKNPFITLSRSYITSKCNVSRSCNQYLKDSHLYTKKHFELFLNYFSYFIIWSFAIFEKIHGK